MPKISYEMSGPERKQAMSDFRTMKEIGPPPEWSGAVASAIGPEQVKRLKNLWSRLTPDEKREVNMAFDKNFDKMGMGKKSERGKVSESSSMSQIDDAYSEAQDSTVEAIGATAPRAKTPYSSKSILGLYRNAQAVLDAWKTGIKVTPAKTGEPLYQLPADIYAILTAINEFVKSQDAQPQYIMDLESIPDDGALLRIKGRLGLIAGDRDLYKAATQTVSETPVEKTSQVKTDSATIKSNPEEVNERLLKGMA